MERNLSCEMAVLSATWQMNAPPL